METPFDRAGEARRASCRDMKGDVTAGAPAEIEEGGRARGEACLIAIESGSGVSKA
jgi:hypothetical protein